MHTNETHVIPRRGWSRVAPVAIAAAFLLAGSMAPAAAFFESAWPEGATTQRVGPPPSHRHFYRSAPHHAFLPSGMTAMVEANDAAEQEMAYCSARFRSYDPSTGTYLGYDGHEHACP